MIRGLIGTILAFLILFGLYYMTLVFAYLIVVFGGYITI